MPVGVGIPTVKIDRMTVGGTARMISPEELAADAVKPSRSQRGATDAECTIAEGEEFSAQVRMRALEKLKDAGSRRAGLRVLIGPARRLLVHLRSFARGNAPDGGIGAGAGANLHRRSIRRACPIRLSSARSAGDLRLYSDDIRRFRDSPREFEPPWKREEAALSLPTRASPIPKARRSVPTSATACSRTRAGFTGSYRMSSCSLSATPVATRRLRHGARLTGIRSRAAIRISKARPTLAAAPPSEPCAAWMRAKSPRKKCR